MSRLDLPSLYGAVFLKQFFPFISVGSEYAGQLTGFTTSGSDLTYLLTDFLPYLLTIVFGIPLLRSVSSRSSPLFSSAKLGIAVPFAYAPFVAVTGDYYEMGSIITSRLVSFSSPGFAPLRWRSDDMLKLSHQLFFSGHPPKAHDVLGVSASFLLGLALIFCTYCLGVFCSGMVLKGTGGSSS